MAKIKVGPDENFTQALRRFNRLVKEEGILDELKERQYYMKPSMIKKDKMKELKNKFNRLRRKSRNSKY
ncbi:30S ribosomal protein S21 [candidate division WWE3 bacterium CG08_land_8_20_14_0_20_43_13]|uniref:Small ribosomal subunit protein bS21 n=1 Tax=candidate division WWE3 bacterium CG08_land_8_20_14_0_20_43_13 TaxID=1975087 RepID=A0A2H0X7C2_UNCKA|nr:MAG: 30S ribosomal protein S21 [candidate division WWE3 bacterium CG08_land_8_20_14_0_20_43_13]